MPPLGQLLRDNVRDAVLRGTSAVFSGNCAWHQAVAANHYGSYFYHGTYGGFIDNQLTAYMDAYGVPDLSLAISKDGSLVFAKSYTRPTRIRGDWAQLAFSYPAADQLYRIASVSKPVTSLAVTKLVESGGLGFDDKVFGDGAILGTTYGTPSADIKAITVRHLLSHTSGWTNQPEDPMFTSATRELSQAELIAWVMEHQPNPKPGQSYEYLNFGYCVLARVIEKVSGQPYEDYVRNTVLGPLGISRMRIAAETIGGRDPDEVVYHASGQTQFDPCHPIIENDPYKLKTRRMDAHGGWIASTVDLLRFMRGIEPYTHPVKIFGADPNTWQEVLHPMFTPSAVNQNYALGWGVELGHVPANPVRPGSPGEPEVFPRLLSWNHIGAMCGTVAYLSGRADGFACAAVANTRPKDDCNAAFLASVVNGLLRNIDRWPACNLFRCY